MKGVVYIECIYWYMESNIYQTFSSFQSAKRFSKLGSDLSQNIDGQLMHDFEKYERQEKQIHCQQPILDYKR